MKKFLREQCKVLIIGAGGLGCEIVANLALTGFSDLHIIDMVSNLLYKRRKANIMAGYNRRF